MKHRPLPRYHQSKLDAAFIRVYREEARKTQDGKCYYCRDRLTASLATADHLDGRRG